jgi:hypothetical protein
VLADDEEHARVRLEEGYGTLDDEQVHNSEIDHVEVF